MKRSEMINMIFCKIPTLSIPRITELLNLIEEAGMLPPPEMDYIEYSQEDATKALAAFRNNYKWEVEDDN